MCESIWFSGVNSLCLDPGETIVVFENLEKTPWLKKRVDTSLGCPF
jgi:hypothetical protein